MIETGFFSMGMSRITINVIHMKLQKLLICHCT